jgi:HlyD family secretion protein
MSARTDGKKGASMATTPSWFRRTRNRVILGIVLLLAIGTTTRVAIGPKVQVLRVERRPLVQKVVANGRVRVPVRIRPGTQVGGVVGRLLVDKGDRVRPGDLLLELVNAEERAGVAQAAARLQQVRELDSKTAAEEQRQAEVSLAQAERQMARVQALADGQVVARQQLEEAAEARDLASSRKESAMARVHGNAPGGSNERLAAAQLAAAEARLAQTRVTAPSAGTIIERLVQPGDIVQPGQALLDVAQDGPTWLTVQPEEKNLAYLRVGQAAQASADAFPDSVFAARVTRLAPAVDPARGTIELDLLVDHPPSFLRPDMTVSINVEVASRESALVLPAETVREAETTPWVLVARHRRAERQPVALGLRGEGMVEIAAGLREGDLVISPEAVKIRSGARVRAVIRGR